jgi:hypothetical protein
VTHVVATVSPLDRPITTPAAPLDERPSRDQERDEANITPVVPWTVTYRSTIVWVSWLAILLSLTGLDRLTGWVGRIPLFIEATAERSGRRAPRWIGVWAAWVRLSPIGRAYETINLSLRILEQPQPAYVTPAERARRLTSLVPDAQARVQGLSEAHERALFAGEETNVSKARLAAAVILLTTIRARLIQLGNSFEQRFFRPDSFQ